MPVLRLAWFLLLGVSFAILTLACDPAQEIKYVNSTDQHVTVLLEGGVHAELGPFQTKKVLTIEFIRPRTISATNEDGDTVFSETFTWDELRERNWTIVFEELGDG